MNDTKMVYIRYNTDNYNVRISKDNKFGKEKIQRKGSKYAGERYKLIITLLRRVVKIDQFNYTYV